MARKWRGEGPTYHVDWGGRTWVLRVDERRPCLRAEDDEVGPFLGLFGVAESGRWAPSALCGATLLGHECRLGRVEATYAPLGWGALRVRAAWSPSADDGIELEVQVSARSVGRLHAVEVMVVSGMWYEPEKASRFVEPRDARSAALSYDGREPGLGGLTTLPPRDACPNLRRFGTSVGPPYYAEFIHSRDVSRRITRGGSAARATRLALFGHDLERGVVLRARVRGHWLGDESPRRRAFELRDAFLREPPPLTT